MSDHNNGRRERNKGTRPKIGGGGAFDAGEIEANRIVDSAEQHLLHRAEKGYKNPDDDHCCGLKVTKSRCGRIVVRLWLLWSFERFGGAQNLLKRARDADPWTTTTSGNKGNG